MHTCTRLLSITGGKLFFICYRWSVQMHTKNIFDAQILFSTLTLLVDVLICRSLNLVIQWLGLFLQVVALLILGKILYIYFDQLCFWFLKTFSHTDMNCFVAQGQTYLGTSYNIRVCTDQPAVVMCMHVHCRLLSLVSYRLIKAVLSLQR